MSFLVTGASLRDDFMLNGLLFKKERKKACYATAEFWEQDHLTGRGK